MNFDFIPYQLNADISDFKGNVEFISSYNGVDLYRAKDGFIKALLGFSVKLANLYFFEGSLITAYIQLGEASGQLHNVKTGLEETISVRAKIVETDSGFIYYWQRKSQFLGLLIQQAKNTILLYHSITKFCVFKSELNHN